LSVLLLSTLNTVTQQENKKGPLCLQEITNAICIYECL
jgi:hypothetical protein